MIPNTSDANPRVTTSTPVGSMLLGPRELIAHGRRIRKLFGGAMRQVGYLAAASVVSRLVVLGVLSVL